MHDPTVIEGRLDAAGKRFAIVASRFNERITSLLIDGAIDCLVRHGGSIDDLLVVRVPGAWEIPLTLDRLAAQGNWHGLVALGVVIRGETPHFDYVAGPCSSGVAAVSERHGIPVGFGVLTCDTSSQAEERAGGKAGNKGWDAAAAALEMVDVLAQLRGDRS
ncbi:MAG: 6,7-dimethyl-8-ribityllumazine synthase [Acidobacteriota bacterium]